jgi:hypothetical protein
MFKGITSRLFQNSKVVVKGESQPNSERPPIASDYPIDSLVPIILPPELLTMEWPGSIIPLGDLPFSLAWAVVVKPNQFRYVNQETQADWEASGVDWRACAMQNLKRIARQFPFFEKCDEYGRPFVQALITDDAIGPSRLLIPHLFEEQFGDDYMVAIPEKTCAIIYSAKLTGEQRVDVDEWIDGCYKVGRERMSVERFRPERFWVL